LKKQLTDEALIAAMDHPTRVHIMSVLAKRVASPTEIAKELGRDLNYLSYHVRRLKELGLIELVRIERTPGGRVTGRFYRATTRTWIDSERWQRMPEETHSGITGTLLDTCNADLRAAITAGTIHGDDNVIARIPLTVDRPGYEEVVELLDETIQRVLAIQDRAAARMKDDDDPLLAKVHIVHFESPAPQP
jgi:DNA-binding transcriptional ArsR family regulator